MSVGLRCTAVFHGSVFRVFVFPRWARVSKLFILVGVIVGVILLATFGILESVRQVNV